MIRASCRHRSLCPLALGAYRSSLASTMERIVQNVENCVKAASQASRLKISRYFFFVFLWNVHTTQFFLSDSVSQHASTVVLIHHFFQASIAENVPALDLMRRAHVQVSMIPLLTKSSTDKYYLQSQPISPLVQMDIAKLHQTIAWISLIPSKIKTSQRLQQ